MKSIYTALVVHALINLQCIVTRPGVCGALEAAKDETREPDGVASLPTEYFKCTATLTRAIIEKSLNSVQHGGSKHLFLVPPPLPPSRSPLLLYNDDDLYTFAPVAGHSVKFDEFRNSGRKF